MRSERSLRCCPMKSAVIRLILVRLGWNCQASFQRHTGVVRRRERGAGATGTAKSYVFIGPNFQAVYCNCRYGRRQHILSGAGSIMDFVGTGSIMDFVGTGRSWILLEMHCIVNFVGAGSILAFLLELAASLFLLKLAALWLFVWAGSILACKWSCSWHQFPLAFEWSYYNLNF